MIAAIVCGAIGLLVVVFALLGIRYVPANRVGIVTRTMLGTKMPQGHIIARNNEMGVQAKTVMPGLYWMFPVIFGVTLVPVTVIPEGQVGVVEAIDGDPLQHGRLLGDSVDCNSFQDAKKFLESNGRKGPQVAILRPGIYRINTKLFVVTVKSAIGIAESKVGVVTANDGIPLPAGYVISPAPKRDHKYYQDGQEFVNNEGYRGIQLETLQPGEYYINPLLFDVTVTDRVVVPPGYVAVVVSNTGKELDRSAFKTKTGEQDKTHDESEMLLITDKLGRGILTDPVAPGSYNLNILAYSPILVPISAVTVDWAVGPQFRLEGSPDAQFSSGSYTGGKSKSVLKETIASSSSPSKAEEFFKFSQLEVITKDGFHLQVDARIVIRIEPKDASFVIARFGSVQNLIQQIVHPLIDSSFRNEAGKEDALSFINNRVELQEKSFKKAVDAFSQHHVMVQNLLVGFIAAPADLLATQSLKQIATQQKTQYAEQAAAASELIQVREKEARAAKQTDVVNAELEIKIQENRASAKVAEADGTRRATIAIAEGQASQVKQIGDAQASAYTAQAKAMGSDAIAGITLLQKIADGKIKVVPDIYVGSEGSSGILGGFLAKYISGIKPTGGKDPEEVKVENKEKEIKK